MGAAARLRGENGLCVVRPIFVFEPFIMHVAPITLMFMSRLFNAKESSSCEKWRITENALAQQNLNLVILSLALNGVGVVWLCTGFGAYTPKRLA